MLALKSSGSRPIAAACASTLPSSASETSTKAAPGRPGSALSASRLSRPPSATKKPSEAQ